MRNITIGDTQKHFEQPVNSPFILGVASSAYQTEGAHLADGKGPSIWDEFTNKRGKVFNNQTGNDACQFYYRYPGDLEIFHSLGIKNFRFSISWPRIFPKGRGTINQAGITYYHRLIDRCLELDIEPWITLYHWDLPLELEHKGGWTNRDIVGWFEDYAAFCAREFGDKVKNWMVLNEPLVFTGAGYFYGLHAPGKRSLGAFLAAVHHATLAQAAGGRALRALVPNANIGTTVSCSHITPKNNYSWNIKAAKKVDALLNRLFVEPFLGLGYPIQDFKALNMLTRYMQPGDESRMQFDFDFLGVQNYTREIVKYSILAPIIRASIVPVSKRNAEVTEMDWEVYPEGLYQLLMKYSSYSGIKKIIVTENGAAFPDQRVGAVVQDPKRMNFMDAHLSQLNRAVADGAKVGGYFIWTMLDNFEWAEGYRPRFGLIYVDFKTQKRILKQSALWYADYITANSN